MITKKIIFWDITLLTIIGVIYLVSDTLVPFVILFIFAYLLQPVIETNCKRVKLLRVLVTFGVFSLLLSSVITIIVLIVSMIYQQMLLLSARFHNIVITLKLLYQHWISWINSTGYSLLFP